MAADKSISDIDLAEFQTPNRRASGLIKGAEAFHRISDEPEPEDAYMPALGLSPIKEYVEGKSGMLSIPDPKKIFTKCLTLIVLRATRRRMIRYALYSRLDNGLSGSAQELTAIIRSYQPTARPRAMQ